MAGHKKGKKRAERRERAAARESDAAQQLGPSHAIQRCGPGVGVQQFGRSVVLQQSEAGGAAHRELQRSVSGVEEEGNTEQTTNVEESRLDEQTLATSTEEQRERVERWLTQQEKFVMGYRKEGEAVPTDIVSIGDDHAGPSATSEQSRHGNVSLMDAEREVVGKRRGRE